MAEVPEHLLRRARERRAALSGGDAGAAGAAGDGGAAAPAGDAGATPASPAPAGTTPARTPAAPAERTAAAPAVVEEAPAPPPHLALEREARKNRLPVWVIPVFAVLPLWAWLYLGAFGNRAKAEVVDPVTLGDTTFHSAGCSSCHGANGEGGKGPALQNGGAAKTFPDANDQISWVKTGSGPFAGKYYGDPNRDGGQHGPATGGMPAFGGSLSDAQISAVVQYERTKL